MHKTLKNDDNHKTPDHFPLYICFYYLYIIQNYAILILCKNVVYYFLPYFISEPLESEFLNSYFSSLHLIKIFLCQ